MWTSITMYNGGKQNEKNCNEEWTLSTSLDDTAVAEDKSCIKVTKSPHNPSDKNMEANMKSSDDSDLHSSRTSPVPQSSYDQSSRRLTVDDSDLVDDSTSAARLSSSSLVSVTSASTSSFYPTLSASNGLEINRGSARAEQSRDTKGDHVNAINSWFSDRHKKYTVVQSRLNELYETIEGKDRQLRVIRNGLNEKDLEIGKLCDRIRALENNCERLQSVIESVGDEADQNELKLQEIAEERDSLLVRNASLSRQMEFEKREWSIERERLSMELDDVTRELELQKMILNGESISEIVQRWQAKVFELEGMVADRDRAIRAQQKRISKLKQSLAETDRISYGDSLGSQTKLDSSSFAFLKRVLLQYLTSSDEECMQLLRSVSNALHLSDEEEREIWANLRSKLQFS